MVGGAFVQIDFLPKPLVLATKSHFQNMKTKIALVLMFLWSAGCQQKSEIDKCVEALEKEVCHSDKLCMEQAKDFNEGRFRLQCLRAQAGKE